MKKQVEHLKTNFLTRLLYLHSSVRAVLTFLLFLHVSLIWGQGKDSNNKGRVFTWDNTAFLEAIAKAPLEKNPNAEAQSVGLSLPMLDGTEQMFRFLESPVLESGLVSNWIPVKTYQGHSADLKTIVRLSVSKQFGVTIFLNTSGGMVAIQPVDVLAKTYKIAPVTNEEGFECFTKEAEDVKEMAMLIACGSHAGTRRDYRFAVAATGEYTVFRGGTATVQSDITNLINYLNTLYEVEMALHFNLVSGNNSIIYTDGTTDPFTPSTGSSSAAASQAGFNTAAFTGVMPASNYDIGHTLHYRNNGSGWDGQAGPGPCSASNNKAAGWSQINLGATFDLPRFGGIVGHEVAHQLGANHPFFSTSGSCNGNRSTATAYEPGAASSYMSYNGSCTPDNIGSGSRDLYFHTVNLNEIRDYLTGTGNSCAVSTPTSNTAPSVNGNPNGLTFNIPTRTPFELTGSATDAEGNTLTYTWEEFDTDMTSGGASPNAAATTTSQPLFRSFPPTSSPTRIVPQLSNILANSQTQGEILPQVARTMKFRLTARDRYTAGGVVLGGWACDEITLNVVDIGATGFALTSQNTAETWTANGTNMATITWNVAGTTAAPISCANVKILFSTDNGATFPYTLAASVPNNGSANVVIPSYPTFTGRVKIVCAAGNIFFDINNAPITISSSCAAKAATVAPTTSVSALAGASALNLGLTPQYGTAQTSWNASIPTTPTMRLTFDNAGCSSPFSNSPGYTSYDFQVGLTGSYTFTLNSASGTVMNLYEVAFDATNTCQNWLASSASGSGSVNTGSTIARVLSPGINYILVVSRFSTGDAAASRTITFTPPSGGSVLTGGPANPGASFNYAYVVVNTTTNNITAIQATSNLTAAGTFPIGTYKVYGLSHANTTTLASLQTTYGGGAFTTLQSALAALIFCGDLSTNNVMVTVTPPCVLPIINAPTLTQPTCTLATGTIVVNATVSGTLEYSIDNGGTWTTFNTFANLVAGNYTVRVRLQSDPSCIATYVSNPVVINAQPVTPSAPIVGAITNATCAVATGSVALSGLPASWTLTRSPGAVATSGTGATSTPSGLAVGSYTYTVTNTASGCTSVASATVGISPYPTSLSTLAIAPSAAVSAAAGAATLNLGLSPQYGTDISPFAGSITATSTASNLSYSRTWSSGTCGGPSNANKFESVTFQVNNSGTYNFSNTSSGGLLMNLYQTSFSATSVCTNWLASSGTQAASGGSISLGGTFSYALTPGVNYVLVVSTFSNTFPATLPATFSVAISGAGSAFNGIPNSGATFGYAYVVVNTATNNITAIQANSDLTSFSGGIYKVYGLSYQTPTTLATLQTYVNGTFAAFQTALTSFTFCGNLSSNNVDVTITGGSCPTLTAAPANVTIVNSTCASACTVSGGSITAPTGTPCPVGSTLQYSVGGGAWSTTLPTYTSTAQSIQTRCSCTSDATMVSTASVAVVTVPGTCTTPGAPTVGTITPPTCVLATGSVELTGLPASGTWTLTRSPGGTTTMGTGLTMTISSLAAGTYTYTVTNASGCVSVASSNVVIPVQPVTPGAPTVGTITQPTCAVPTGSFTLSGLPSGNWTINPGAITGSTATHPVTGVAAGTYSYTVTNSVGCTSTGVSVVVTPAPGAPSAPVVGTITPPTCVVATGSVELSGLPTSGTWTLTRSPGGTTTMGTGATTSISSLSSGTYTYTVANDLGCTSAASLSVVINAAPTPPSVPVGYAGAQPTCGTPTGTIVFDFQSGVEYSVNNGTSYQVDRVFSGLAAGTYTLRVRSTTDNTCSTAAAATVVINAVPGAPSAPTANVAQPSCSISTGTIVITAPVAGAGVSYSVTGTNPVAAAVSNTTGIFPRLAAGDYDVKTTVNGCTSAATPLTVNPQPVTPARPIAIVTTHPTCVLTTGVISISTPIPGAGVSYSVTGTNPVVATVSNTNGTFFGLAPGAYDVKTTLNTCTSDATSLTINPRPVTPSAPTASVTVQPSCALATGTITVTVPANGATVSYSVTGTTPVVALQSNATGIFSGLAAGNYDVKTTLGACTSTATPLTVNAAPRVPTVEPITGTLTLTTCAGVTTTLASTTPGGTWSSASMGVATISATGVVTGVSAGTSVISYSVSNATCTTTVTATVTVSTCCPVLSAAAPAAVVINNTCGGLFTISSSGSISAPTTLCPVGSTIQYSIDNFATAPLSAPPAYTGVALRISTRCSCNASPSTVSPTTNVTTSPQICGSPLWITGGNSTITTCNGVSVTLSGSTSGGTWSSLNPLVANISSSGVVTGMGAGTAYLSYSITHGIITTTVTTSVTVTNCPFPILRDGAPPVRIINSACLPGCISVVGSIATSLNVCPFGSVLEYSVDSFRRDSSFRLPIYAATPMAISTRCRYETPLSFIVSPITTVKTLPAPCLPTCIPTLTVAGGVKRETGDAVSANVGLFTNGLSQGLFNGSTYNWSNLASGQSFSIRPSRNDNPLVGVSTLDLTLISRHILDFNKFTSPYKIIAADVNRDGEVDAADMLLIRRLILRLIDDFPGNTAWRFVEKKYVFRNPTNPLAEDFPEIINLANLQTNVSNADFVAVKVGDVNYSAVITNGNPTNTSVELRGNKPVTLELTDQILEKGKFYRIPLTVSSTARLTGLQFGLNWDRNKVDNLSIESGSLPNFSEGNTAVFGKAGVITSAWANTDGVAILEPTTVFYLVVQPKNSTRLTEIFSKNDVYTEGVAYDVVGNGSAVNLRFLPATKSDFQLMPNHPNPFTNETVIPFLLPEDGQVTLTIYDLTGKPIFVKKETFAKGYNELLFKSEKDIPEGLYLYRLQTDTQMAERKMMIRR